MLIQLRFVHSNLPSNLFVVCPLFSFSFEHFQLSGNFSVLEGKLKRSPRNMFQIEKHIFSTRDRREIKTCKRCLLGGGRPPTEPRMEGSRAEWGLALGGKAYGGHICWGWVRVFPLSGGKIWSCIPLYCLHKVLHPSVTMPGSVKEDTNGIGWNLQRLVPPLPPHIDPVPPSTNHYSTTPHILIESASCCLRTDQRLETCSEEYPVTFSNQLPFFSSFN